MEPTLPALSPPVENVRVEIVTVRFNPSRVSLPGADEAKNFGIKGTFRGSGTLIAEGTGGAVATPRLSAPFSRLRFRSYIRQISNSRS
jgi:hypothetical protein